MRLESCRVALFRNIIDSTDVPVDSEITCLVGKNESGKTAFLHALHRLNAAKANPAFSVHDHYPAWLQKNHRGRGDNLNKVRAVRATFVLDDTDARSLPDLMQSGLLLDQRLVAERDYAGELHLSLQVNEGAAVNHLAESLDVPATVDKELRKANSLKDLLNTTSSLTRRANIKARVKEDLAKVASQLRQLLGDSDFEEAVCEKLRPRLPRFFYFDTYSVLPYSVEIRPLFEKAANSLTDQEMTAKSFLEIASAEKDYLLNPDYEQRKRELENVANGLTAEVATYWSQNPQLRVTPDITQQTVTDPHGQRSVLHELKIRIWDERHQLSLPFNEHSTGFQWFFSFLAAFSEFENTSTPIVILLDEPALGLHARAQSDFLSFIENRLAQKCQVIYTTHSPFMIQPDKLHRVRIVEDRGRETGMQVSCDVLAKDPDTLFPLQGALGYDLAQHLFVAPHNLVVEGTSDFAYLSLLSDHLRQSEQGSSLDERWSIVPVGGADLIPTFLALLGTHLHCTVLVDSSKSGHQKLSRLAQLGYVATDRIITVGELTGTTPADIEDLFEPADYLALYNQAFGKSWSVSDLAGTPPIVQQLARLENVPRFDHGKPAEVLLREREKSLSGLSQESLANFSRLFERVNKTLDT